MTQHSAGGDHVALGRRGGPAILVVHDWFGLLPHVRQLCEALAAEGFTALAVDLYDGRSTTDPAEAADLMDELDVATAQATIAAGVRRLRGVEAMAPRIGGLGFSMGGWLALHAATKGLFDAVVTYYAALDSGETQPTTCPLLLNLAQVDEWDPPDAPERFAQAVEAAGMPVQVQTLPGTEHSFANADVAAYDHVATAVAWESTLAFMRRVLGR